MLRCKTDEDPQMSPLPADKTEQIMPPVVSFACLILKSQLKTRRWPGAGTAVFLFLLLISFRHCPKSYLGPEFEEANLPPQDVLSL